MASVTNSHEPMRNRLLAALSPSDYAQLHPHLEYVDLSLKQVLYDFDTPIPHVYFPLTGVVSLLAASEEQTLIEVGSVGYEGMVGLALFLGADRTQGKAFAQIPGPALRLGAETFTTQVQQLPALHQLLHRYTLALFTQISQSAACNRLHSIEARCSRWLLMTHDRVGADQFRLTHEFLSQMLGVRRATVSVVARALQQAGLIRYHRGIITILDRAGLEEISCQCYTIIHNEYNRLFNLSLG